MLPILLAGSAVLMLAACGKEPETARNQSAEEVASEMKKITLLPGEWETTQEVVDVKLEGAPEGMPAGAMDAMKGRKTTVKTCITPEQAANPSADFLTAQKDSNCTYSGFEMAGGAIKGAVSCLSPDGKGKADIAIDGSYGADSYQMTMEMQAAGMGGPQTSAMTMHLKMRTSGKRIGECPASPATGG
ncbi:hypothetical protein GCM10007897_29040 [Sphingobium jiangsuense]|nr:hypothetical protein GCM10007897_29040 [Sphingobium jiangsuense]